MKKILIIGLLMLVGCSDEPCKDCSVEVELPDANCYELTRIEKYNLLEYVIHLENGKKFADRLKSQNLNDDLLPILLETKHFKDPDDSSIYYPASQISKIVILHNGEKNAYRKRLVKFKHKVKLLFSEGWYLSATLNDYGECRGLRLWEQ